MSRRPSEVRLIAAPGIHVRAMERLVTVMLELSLTREVAPIFEMVPRAARDLCGADGASLVLLEHDLCSYAAEDAVAPLWKGQRKGSTACIAGWVAANRQIAVVPDVSADDRITDGCRGTFVKSLVAIPIRFDDPIGVIEAYWRTPRRADENELQLLSALADATGAAFDNVSVYGELRRALEEASVARASAERASQLKSSFLAMLSHELRSPLGSLSLALERVADELAAPGAADDPQLFDRMRASTERLSGIIETLLEHARVDAGRLSLHLDTIDPARAAEEAIDGVRQSARRKGLTLALELGRDLPRLRSDPRLVRVVLSNLVDNAVKFTERGSVTVRVAFDGQHLTFAVADTGPGISPADRVRIFAPFETLEPVRHKHRAGVGLGLALVDSIANALGATIALDSKVGHGSTFTLMLPA